MWEQLKRRSSYQALPTIDMKKPTDLFRDLHHPIFQSIRIIHVRNSTEYILYLPFHFERMSFLFLSYTPPSLSNILFCLFICAQTDSSRHDSSYIQNQTIITLTKLITPPAMLQCLRFIYAGTIDKECSNLKVSKKHQYILPISTSEQMCTPKQVYE